MKVLMFQPQFADLVAEGSKIQTVRPPRKQPFEPGEIISARKWSGVAYRSPQIEIAQIRILNLIHGVTISEHGIETQGTFLEGQWVDDAWEPTEPFEVHQFAKDDGFQDWPKMREWFRRTHALPSGPTAANLGALWSLTASWSLLAHL